MIFNIFPHLAHQKRRGATSKEIFFKNDPYEKSNPIGNESGLDQSDKGDRMADSRQRIPSRQNQTQGESNTSNIQYENESSKFIAFDDITFDLYRIEPHEQLPRQIPDSSTGDGQPEELRHPNSEAAEPRTL